jgi:hypothetical protein
MSREIAELLRKLQPEIDWVATPGPSRHTESVDEPGLASLLLVNNGLSAFRGGLRIFGTAKSLLPTIEEWNRPDLWRCEYRGLDHGIRFFAEDFLGNQFGFDDQGVVRFLAETGDREPFGRTFEDWLEKLLSDPVEELELWLLDEWLCGNLQPTVGEHLCPKIPFVAKGPAESQNLYACGRVESMRFKGSFAHQIRNVPTGGQIDLRVK